MDKYKKLVMNSVVFAIGNLGSKFISIIMVPLYTHMLSTEEYGKVDLITTAISLLLPLLSLSIGQAVIRYAVANSKHDDEVAIFSNAISLNVFGILLILLIYPILSYFEVFGEALNYFIVLLIFQMFGDTLSQFARGIGKVRQYALNGVISTLITACSNIYFLVHLRWGIEGYLISMILASLVSNIYLFKVIQGFKLFSFRHLNKNLLKKMLLYSIPLIPNSVMWWIVNGSTRYFILIFAGVSANGLFAVANKIPSVLSIATNIFSQAWQLSAFEEQDSEDKSSFYSLVFKNYYTILFLFASFLLIINKHLVTYSVAESFSESWKLVPFLLLASMYQSFSGFMGTTYTASLKTKGVFTTSVYAAVVSVIANVILIPLLGVYGAGIGTCLAFIVMWFFRLKDTEKIIGLRVNFKEYGLFNLLFLLQTIVMHILDGGRLLITESLLFLIMCFIAKDNLMIIMKKILKK